MTLRGFERLMGDFNAFGYQFPVEPYLRVNMTMVNTAAEVLNKKVVLNEYLDLFQKESARSVVVSVMESLDKMPSPVKKRATSKMQVPAISQLPPQPGESVRLLNSDDKLLFDLHLYMMTGKIRRKAPWEYLQEDDLFGVQVPGKELVYFVSVMGGGGEFQGISFYKGYEGLVGFLEFRAEVERLSLMGLPGDGLLQASVMPGGVMTIPHLMLLFTDREELGKVDRVAIRKSGAPFRGKGNWPSIQEIVPGHVPVYPSRESLTELYFVLQQVLVVLEKDMHDDNYLVREEDPDHAILVRVPTGKGPRFRWKDHYLVSDPRWGETSYSVDILPASLEAVSRLPEVSQVVQLDLFMLPAPVRVKNGGDYFPFVLMMVDKGSGMVVSMTVVSPWPDLQSMYESVPPKVVEELMKTGHRPSEIEIRSDLLLGMLKEILEKAGCFVVPVERMPEMDEAISSIIADMS